MMLVIDSLSIAGRKARASGFFGQPRAKTAAKVLAASLAVAAVATPIAVAKTKHAHKPEESVPDAAPTEVAAPPAPVHKPPTIGVLTSTFGERWGEMHCGVDIAGPIGTPIVAVTDGTVLEAGEASGFGQWVRVQQSDGTVGVFGHVDQFFVTAGQHVRAGDVIATLGNRGESTGPHLHYEVWLPDGTKIDPMPWLEQHGIHLGPLAV